ncbi:hypothetical protein FA15DRAFT_676350, partial [Coprinopsis marcescibilis]
MAKLDPANHDPQLALLPTYLVHLTTSQLVEEVIPVLKEALPRHIEPRSSFIRLRIRESGLSSDATYTALQAPTQWAQDAAEFL